MKTRILIKGAITGLVSALIGIFIFTSIQEIHFIFEFGWGESMFGLIFFVGLGLVTIPSLLAGLFLSTILYEDFLQNRLKISTAVLKGGALGLIISLGLCALVFILINGRATFSIFLTYTLEAIIIAILCGVYTGRKIAMNILKTSSIAPIS
jgi:hypothetical protein